MICKEMAICLDKGMTSVGMCTLAQWAHGLRTSSEAENILDILLDLAIQEVLQLIRIVLWDSHRSHVGALDVNRVEIRSAVLREGC